MLPCPKETKRLKGEEGGSLKTAVGLEVLVEVLINMNKMPKGSLQIKRLVLFW
jgi:hypothetical protein